MYVRSDNLDEEVRITTDTVVALVNGPIDGDDADGGDGPVDPEWVRQVLVEHEFVRAAEASVAEIAELVDRIGPIARLVRALPDAVLAEAVESLNHQLRACAIAPSLSAHDGSALHIHWTGAESPFAHQVVVDLLMALAQVLCDHGTDRFGRCGADGCDRVFHDTTKNRSRRFCDDPRCASRTHTAAHRARNA